MTLDNLRRWNKHIHAFVALADPELERRSGPLTDVTVGIKDIIDVAGLPTKCGSATCADALNAESDAPAVASLRAAGAKIVGKTTTTEFAFTDPTSCRNPHDLRRSPGGSSSGSGAAVAAGVVDIALGTQTAGSLCRPAAYCGIVGFKPTFGLLPTKGVAPLSPSFDTVGIVARSVALAQASFEVMAPAVSESVRSGEALCGLWDNGAPVQPDWSAALSDARSTLGDVLYSNLPTDADAIVSAHRSVMFAEAAIAHGRMLKDARAELLRPKFRAALEAGLLVSSVELEEGKEVLTDARKSFWRALGDVNLVLTLPVPDGAPLLDGTTGFQDWLTPWTVFGGPLLCLPWGVDRLSRPCSIMLAAHPWHDRWLLNVGSMLEAKAPGIPIPQLPSNA